MDTNDWIPTASFVDYHILEEALKQNISIKKASTIVLPQFGLPSNGEYYHRQIRLLGMCYTLLVFPQQNWKRDGLLEIVVERAKIDKQLSKKCNDLLNTDFLRQLRNAVSHARIIFLDDSITFLDGPNGKPSTFEVTLTIGEAVNLLLVLGRAFHESTQVKEIIANSMKSK